jgi:hypothetical protein
MKREEFLGELRNWQFLNEMFHASSEDVEWIHLAEDTYH